MAKIYNKSFKFVPGLRPSTGRGSATPLNSNVIRTWRYSLSNDPSKPAYLTITDKFGLKVPLIWCVSAALVGTAGFNATDALVVSAMSLIMAWVGLKITSFVLGFQKNSGILSNLAYDRVIKFIWFSSAFGWLVSVIYAVVKESEFNFFFYVVFSIVYFGFALAAARKWGCYYTQQY